MNIARDIFMFLWGAFLASGWWAIAMFGNVGLENGQAGKFPFLIIAVVALTLLTLGVIIHKLVTKAFSL